MKSWVYYLAYFGIREPACQSQVITPVKKLLAQGVPIILIAFEGPWRWLKNKGGDHNPGVPTIYLPRIPRNFLWLNSLMLWWVVRQCHVNVVIHARGTQAAHIALQVKRLMRNTKVICDFRGVEPEEYKYVNQNGDRLSFSQELYYKKLQRIMISSVRNSDAVFTVSKSLVPTLKSWEAKRILHVPCCVDTDLYENAVDSVLEWELKNRFVVVYSGSIKDWQCFDCVTDIFLAIKEQEPKAFLLVLTPDVWIKNILTRIPLLIDYKVLSVPHKEIQYYLSLGKIGLLIRENNLVNEYACPIKLAEYLAAGLHVITTPFSKEVTDLVFHNPEAGTLLSFPPYVEGTKIRENMRHRFVDLENRVKTAILHTDPVSRQKRKNLTKERMDWRPYIELVKKEYEILS